MDFILIENVNEELSVVWERNIETLPSNAIAFTYYQQGNGMVTSFEYRIGKPVKFAIGDIFIELEAGKNKVQNEDICCLYFLNEEGNRIIRPINKNTTLVSNFSELEEAYNSIIKKGTTRKR